MPFSFPFFRSQSNLLGNKRDNLQQTAAEDSKLRLDYEKGRKELRENEMKNSEIEFFQNKYDFNLKEIDRRREAVNKLELEEAGYQRRIDTLIETSTNDSKVLEHNMKLSKELHKKVERVQILRRHYDAEITHLEEQNEVAAKKMN